MNKSIQTVFILMVMFFFVSVITGCQNQLSTGSTKLVAAKNIELKKELDTCKKELDKQVGLLAACTKEKAALDNQLQQGNEDLSKVLLETVGDQIAQLQEENAKLKAELDALKKQQQLAPDTTKDKKTAACQN
jgi:uncharacterized protein (DUF342 family)